MIKFIIGLTNERLQFVCLAAGGYLRRDVSKVRFMPKRNENSIDSGWFEAFVAVMLHDSFDAAAKALGCGQSTISTRVAKLESWLGRSLFHRKDNRARPNDFALTFRERATDALIWLEELRSVKTAGVTSWARLDKDQISSVVPEEPTLHASRPVSAADAFLVRSFGSSPRWNGQKSTPYRMGPSSGYRRQAVHL